ncbi:alpha/beta hydrolase family protein [Flavobacterium cellulosilyticum]|uniref:Fungal lipase-like domain-containing protein n=1 Tax=Flavobacterium cellulosilyticum TaxID=2541731 RepID=A0A4R5CG00_9FLAO|nr:hypothetical protein [Flavobacterium cellulosilyticum]TDD98565.1 hypothetical protein E0F76_05400 [Flavobacterium cellulosilyticum]
MGHSSYAQEGWEDEEEWYTNESWDSNDNDYTDNWQDFLSEWFGLEIAGITEGGNFQLSNGDYFYPDSGNLDEVLVNSYHVSEQYEYVPIGENNGNPGGDESEETVDDPTDNCSISYCMPGYTLENCECVKVSCTTTCGTGFILNSDCECVKKPCDEAKVADHIYNTLNGIQEAGKTELNDYGNVHLVSPAGLPSEFNSPDFKWSDPDTGFSSALYSVDHGNGNIELIYATQGTNPLDLQDWVNNGQQALGYVSAQYYQSVANANVLATWAANNGYTLSFTGHSLGGGLANANALATGLPATIYNPAGLSDATVNDPNLNLNLNYSSKVTAFIVQGEPVDYLNTKLDTPVRGTRNYIGLPQDTNSLYGTLSNLTIAGLISTVQLHLMSSVISNLDCND